MLPGRFGGVNRRNVEEQRCAKSESRFKPGTSPAKGQRSPLASAVVLECPRAGDGNRLASASRTLSPFRSGSPTQSGSKKTRVCRKLRLPLANFAELLLNFRKKGALVDRREAPKLGMKQRKSVAVVLFQLGGPDSLEAIEPFLLNLFRDPDIIEFPFSRIAREPLARLISTTRAKRVRDHYAEIGGKSPILEFTQRQAQALEMQLRQSFDARVVVAMRYWHPLTQEALRAAEAFSPDELVLLPLYPQFSDTSPPAHATIQSEGDSAGPVGRRRRRHVPRRQGSRVGHRPPRRGRGRVRPDRPRPHGGGEGGGGAAALRRHDPGRARAADHLRRAADVQRPRVAAPSVTAHRAPDRSPARRRRGPPPARRRWRTTPPGWTTWPASGRRSASAATPPSLDALRAWRGEAARAARIEPEAVLPDHVLARVAAEHPATWRRSARCGASGRSSRSGSARRSSARSRSVTWREVQIEQRFDAPVDAVARAYADPELYATFDGMRKLSKPEVLLHEVDGDVVRLDVRYRFAGELSPAAAR